MYDQNDLTDQNRNYRRFLNEDFITSVRTAAYGNSWTVKSVRERLESVDQDQAAPFDLENFDVNIFTTFLLTLRKPDGSRPQSGTYEGHRTAIGYLYQLYDLPLPSTVQTAMRRRMRGLKVSSADRVAQGESEIKVGMDPLPFGTYRFLGSHWLKADDGIFPRMFMIISWNLMCRANNTTRIHLNHIEWVGDSLVIRFCNMKNDQEGKAPRYPRHIYPNAYMPEVCPILALGLFWLAFPFSSGVGSESRALFTGNCQYSRFSEQLNNLLQGSDEVKEHFRLAGVDITRIGSHSNRKGSCTYCSSGSTACPSEVI